MRCPACLGLMFHLVRSDAPLYRCRECHHCWQWPPDVTAKYDAAYVASRYDSYATTGAMSELRMDIVQRAIGTAKGTILDVGYGNGAFIKEAKLRDHAAYGYDVHGQAAKYGVTEVSAEWECPVPGGWDAVTFFDSLEHIVSLDSVVAKLKGKVRAVVVSWPATPGNFPDFTLDWKHYRPGEHLHYFSPASMLKFGDRIFGRACQLIYDVEDSVRGRLPKGGWNIATSVLTEYVARSK